MNAKPTEGLTEHAALYNHEEVGMTRKERGFVMEGAAIVVAAFLMVIVAPALVNMHDTFAAFAAFALLGLAFAWLAYFVYRITKEK